MRARGIDWAAQPLGQEPDTVIARRLGVSHQSVQQQRRRRRIPAAKPWRRSILDWDDKPLGQMPDADLARLLGCSTSAVCNARKRRKIPGYTPTEHDHRRPHRDTLELLHHRHELSSYAIAELLGVQQKLVYKWLREYGLNRSVREAMKSPVTRKRIGEGVRRAAAKRREAERQEWERMAAE